MYEVEIKSIGDPVLLKITNAAFDNAQRLKISDSTGETEKFIVLFLGRDDEAVIVKEKNVKKVLDKTDE